MFINSAKSILKPMRRTYLRSILRKKIIKKDGVLRINLGSGPYLGENGWLTLDTFGSDLIWDLRDGLPFDDNSIDEFYSSHLLEHLTFTEIIELLSACYTKLSKKGQISAQCRSI
jgi:predicted SAM-dependent methyltransferase